MPNRAFILGAGFTRAFFDDAPLIVGDYAGPLLAEFSGRTHALRVIESEKKRHPRGEVDLENLMTRLDVGMPYDASRDADAELNLLGRAVRRQLLHKLGAIRRHDGRVRELKAFALKCIHQHISCISFNYDDLLDEQLHKAVPRHDGEREFLSWCPERGYGFVMRPSDFDFVLGIDALADTSMHLLKLHGSLNWRVRLGAQPPYRLDDLVHHEPWAWDSSFSAAVIEGCLESIPFIVPPVLMKSQLVAEPVLRAVWTQAHEVLEHAEEVVFIGYSLPKTDIAARFLFSEAMHNLAHSKIVVVNKADGEQRDQIVSIYRDLFSGIPSTNFHFDGALDWCGQI